MASMLTLNAELSGTERSGFVALSLLKHLTYELEDISDGEH